MISNPRLFGINRSNRDFSQKETWGKNQFNSSFPVSLVCYLYLKGLPAVYFMTDCNMKRVLTSINIEDLYQIAPLSNDIYFSFETQYTPFQKYVIGSIPRNDLVVMSNEHCISSFERKLVALPDNSTCNLSEDKFSSEILVRPDTIIYLACSFIKALDDNQLALREILGSAGDSIEDWTDADKVIPYTYDIFLAIKKLVEKTYLHQTPIIMELVWKTDGKLLRLSFHCWDVFVCSKCGLLMLFTSRRGFFVSPACNKFLNKITRHSRSMIWLLKMKTMLITGSSTVFR